MKLYVGDAAGLYLMNYMKELGFTRPVGSLTLEEKLDLVETLIYDLFIEIVSTPKLTLVKSQLYHIMKIGDKIEILH